MKTKNIFLTLALALSTTFAFAQGTIAGSAHDFGDGSANDAWVVAADATANAICKYCHAPHNNRNAATELLWNRAETAVASYTIYTSPTLEAPLGTQPGASSKMCLSCHDGTVALDAYGSNGAGDVATKSMTQMNALADFGTVLSNDHPIGTIYDTNDPGLRAITYAVSGAGTNSGIVDIEDLLAGGTTVECSSCHDVHNAVAALTPKLLVTSNTGSALCLTCHAK